ncbi:increased rDNA silencing protein 4 [Achaetomium macrosporum]|uniref:Increased rDNA silencing protein 4 n=1 Tax=Achaetomium macrosporum TaxID=79813 RepID=A0AAN7CGX3_9PEZI|nr:increased rDNA silencing protein 4 [Achaetomium macrosporum]
MNHSTSNAGQGQGTERRVADNINGALLAATQAAASRPRSAGELRNTAGLSRQVTGTSVGRSGTVQETGPGPTPGGGGGTGGHVHGGMVAQRLAELHAAGGNGSALLSAPGGGSRLGTTSPSLIAATLAASRSASPVRVPSPQPSLESGRVARSRGQSVGAASVTAGSVGNGTRAPARRVEAEGPDTAPIPPTTSLVSLFESRKGQDDVDPVKRRAPPLMRQVGVEKALQEQQKVDPRPKPKPKPKLLPTEVGNSRLSDEKNKFSPRDTHNPPAASSVERRNSQQLATSKPTPDGDMRPSTLSSTYTLRDPPNVVSPRPKVPIKTPRLKPPTPPRRAPSTPKMAEPTVRITPLEAQGSQRSTSQGNQERTATPRRLSHSSASSDDTFVSASSVQSWAMPPARKAGKASDRPAQLGQRPPAQTERSTPDLQRLPARNASTPNLTLSSFTNAIVASNLASARLTPTTTTTTTTISHPPPVPAPRRSGGGLSPLQPQRTADSVRSQQQIPQQRTGGKLLPTLRGPHPSLSDDEDARRRMQHHRRHGRRSATKALLSGGNRKHAHHEGSRRRWRDEVTARERRRYEAVWASNRGLFLRPGWGFTYDQDIDEGRAAEGTPEAELVVNVVVRDIWSRSRLPADELAEVWDLVDRQGRGALGKEEFVVGMWLIDQRLRGRKIPARVSQSVWDSVGGGGRHGVVVPPPSGKGGKEKKKKKR